MAQFRPEWRLSLLRNGGSTYTGLAAHSEPENSSSGGCLFNDNAKVIGMTSAGIEEGENIGFAIPTRYIVDAYDQWNKKDSETLGSAKSWDSIALSSVTEMDYTVVSPYYTRAGKYTGYIADGVPQGFGVFVSHNSEGIEWHYAGAWEAGKMYGDGAIYGEDGFIAKGQFENNMCIDAFYVVMTNSNDTLIC